MPNFKYVTGNTYAYSYIDFVKFVFASPAIITLLNIARFADYEQCIPFYGPRFIQYESRDTDRLCLPSPYHREKERTQSSLARVRPLLLLFVD